MPEARTRVGAVVLLRADAAALLQHRDDKPGLPHAGLWVPPGGHCEAGEPIEACARREFREETGYLCSEIHRLTVIENLRVEGRPPIELTVFWAHYDEVQPVRCLEGQALRFVERRLAASYAMPQYVLGLWDLAIAARQTVRQP